jgi:hypothetical protein
MQLRELQYVAYEQVIVHLALLQNYFQILLNFIGCIYVFKWNFLLYE